MHPAVHALFDDATSTLTYVVWDPATLDGVIIDPVLDFDPAALSTAHHSVGKLMDFVVQEGLEIHWVLETHVHADHLSGGAVLAERLGARTAIGAGVTQVQAVFKGLLGLPTDFPVDGSQWDALMADGVPLAAGSLPLMPIATPGHTPACVSIQIGDALFTGDTMFMPDFGTGRCDFPGGSAAQLYDSIQRLYALPEDTRVFVGHDYQPGGRDLLFETSIGACRRKNKQLQASTPRDQFVAWRTQRDAGLPPPRLLFQALQINCAAGHLPPPEADGRRYLRLPLNAL